ncbi:MAG: NAD(P)-dependent oxidoreductase [Thermodesulfobacteriota bacterium]|nr:NAD(P)-dependent oxidoreductase [Thermodesulfobacteriota bacterium]
MNIIVFGGAGFLGSHIADQLSLKGHAVKIFDTIESPYIRNDQEMIKGDILDEAAVNKAVDGCDAVYNLAAIADIDESKARPVDTARINVLGNAIVLEASRLACVKRFVFASSVYVYSASGAFYKSSKKACEYFISDYHEQYGLEYTILRYGSLYGRRANPGNSIYRYLKEALTTGKITYHGSGDEQREFIHVEDAARASADILSPEFANQHIILTGQRAMRYKDFLEMIQEILGNRIGIEYRKKQSDTHYQITPYNFAPRLGRKYVANTHIDIGQGIMDCISELYEHHQAETGCHPPHVTEDDDGVRFLQVS